MDANDSSPFSDHQIMTIHNIKPKAMVRHHHRHHHRHYHHHCH